MTRSTGHLIRTEARRVGHELAVRLGTEVRTSRLRRRMPQRRLAELVGVSQATVSRIERGLGDAVTLGTWVRLGVALGRPLRSELAADALREPADAGHLLVQELVLRQARRNGLEGRFELVLRPGPGAGSTDVGIRDDRRRTLELIECWNTIGDIGAAARSTMRKVHEAEAHAASVGGERPYRVASCWVVRATRRNRDLVARYPEVFAARFPGSSAGWVAALADGAVAPTLHGLVWCDVEATRLYPHRRPRPGGGRRSPSVVASHRHDG